MSEGTTAIPEKELVRASTHPASPKSTGIRANSALHHADSYYDLVHFYMNLARDFARDLDLDLDLARNPAHTYTLPLARSLARDLDRTLTHALDLASVYDHIYARDLSSTLDVALAHTRDLSSTLDVALAHARDVDRIFVRDRDLALARGLPAFKAVLNIARLLTKSIILLLEIEQDRAKLPYFTLTLEATQHASTPSPLTFVRERRTGVVKFSPVFQQPITSLTPALLKTTVTPYLNALIHIQHLIDDIHGRSPTDIQILGLRPGSVTVDLTGGIRDTLQLVLDLIIPWRRQNQKQLAQMQLTEKEIDLKHKEVEVKQAQAAILHEDEKAKVENDKLEAEAQLLRAQADKQHLENQKMQLEIIKLTLEMVNQVKPNLPDEQRLLYAMKFVDPTRLLATSPLEIIEAVEVVDESSSAVPESQPDEEE